MNPRIRCLIVDDEPLAMEIIAEYAEQVSYLEVVACVANPIEALHLVQQGDIDLVFLDIQMPELTGIQFAKIAGDSCSIILTTANPSYAMEGFELGVIDYLLKPITFERFLKSVQKMVSPRPKSIPVDQNQDADFFFVKADHRTQRINFDEIHFVEGLKDYISIYTDQARIITLMGMKKIEDLLPSKRFVRVHRSYIVAVDKINAIEKNKILILDKAIPIGETYRDMFFKLIQN